MGMEQPAPCEVDYVLRRDSGRDFAAELTLKNVGGRELRDWTMSFTFPGQQTVTKAQPAVQQQGRKVLFRPPAADTALAPGASKTVALIGRYTGGNPLPMEFKMGDQTCGAQVSGVAGSAPTTAPTTKAPTKTKAKAKSSGSHSSGGSGGGRSKPDKPAKAGKGGKGKG